MIQHQINSSSTDQHEHPWAKTCFYQFARTQWNLRFITRTIPVIFLFSLLKKKRLQKATTRMTTLRQEKSVDSFSLMFEAQLRMYRIRGTCHFHCWKKHGSNDSQGISFFEKKPCNLWCYDVRVLADIFRAVSISTTLFSRIHVKITQIDFDPPQKRWRLEARITTVICSPHI